MNATAEHWRPVPGYEGRYEVSDQGRVRSWVSRPAPRLLSAIPLSNRYVSVALSRGGFTKQQLLHRVVLAAFVGPCPTGMETRHLDGNRTNNRLTNLAYGTPRENGLDRVRHGTGYNHNRLKTHCIRGHRFDEANTLMWRGERRCRTCAREASRVYYRAHPRPVLPRKAPRAYVHPNSEKTHCPAGHPYDEINTYWRKRSSGGRACRACRREGMRRRKHQATSTKVSATLAA